MKKMSYKKLANKMWTLGFYKSDWNTVEEEVLERVYTWLRKNPDAMLKYMEAPDVYKKRAIIGWQMKVDELAEEMGIEREKSVD